MTEFVFGYGSLACDGGGAVCLAELRGARRVWGVAMDNTVDLPGYKHYRRRRDGRRPAVCVAFLDLAPSAGQAVNGVCIAVSPRRLARLDARERNYVRVDVTEHVHPRPAGRTWAYVGRADSRARLLHARWRSRAVVSREYRERVLGGFAALGRGSLERFHRSTDLDALPVADLVRVEHA